MLKDAHHILAPMDDDTSNYAMGTMTYHEFLTVPGLANLKHAHNGFSYIKYLTVFKDGTPISRKDADARCICGSLGTDNWRRLTADWKLLEVDHKGPYGLHFWKLTPRGKRVLEFVEANDAFYNVMKWYDPSLDEDAKVVMMMNADLRGEDTHAATSAEGFINMLDSIFNPESLCRKTGSCYRWLNRVVHMMKTSSMFFETMSSPEVMKWLDDHYEYGGVANFKNLVEKLAKKAAKKAAKKMAA